MNHSNLFQSKALLEFFPYFSKYLACLFLAFTLLIISVILLFLNIDWNHFVSTWTIFSMISKYKLIQEFTSKCFIWYNLSYSGLNFHIIKLKYSRNVIFTSLQQFFHMSVLLKQTSALQDLSELDCEAYHSNKPHILLMDDLKKIILFHF